MLCYTADSSEQNINAIRENGCLLAMISLNPNNFASSIDCKPDMCEFLHSSDFASIEDEYLDNLKLY